MRRVMVIRPCEKSEVDKLRAISIQTLREKLGDLWTEQVIEDYIHDNLSYQALAKEVHRPGSYFYFLEEHQAFRKDIVGYIKLNYEEAQTEEGFDNTYEIEKIYVLREYQKQGFGRQLLNYAIQLGKNENKDGIWMGTDEENACIQSFCTKTGFEKIGEHVFILDDDISKNSVMMLEI